MAHAVTTKGYLGALATRIREYDDTGRLPAFFLFQTQFFYEGSKSRLYLSLLEDPLGHDLKLGEGQEKQLKRMEACIDSMTPQERRHPQLLNGSRKKRVARGSGTSVEEINRLLRQYGQMRKLMKRLGKADPRALKRQLGIG